MKPLGLSVNAVSLALRVPATRILAIVREKRRISPDTALRLARFLRCLPSSGSTFRRITILPLRSANRWPQSNAKYFPAKSSRRDQILTHQ